MAEPNNLPENMFELNQIVNNLSKVADPKLLRAILKTIKNIERLYPIFQEGSNNYSSGALFRFLKTKINELIEQLKPLASSNSDPSTNSIFVYNSDAIYNILNDINSALNKFNNNQEDEYKILNDEIQRVRRFSKEFEQNHTDLEDRINTLNKLATDRINEINATFQSKIIELKEQFEESESSIAKKALSASFSNRAKKLQTESYIWLFAILLSIGSLIKLAVLKLNTFPPISDLNFVTLDLHLRASIIYLPICIALFWAIWFCTKRYTHLCHLRDEYNYKHDLSESFIGYKKEVTYLDNLSDSDLKLFPILMSAVIQNICKSPLETNKEECHSPWSEIVSLVCKKGKDKIE